MTTLEKGSSATTWNLSSWKTDSVLGGHCPQGALDSFRAISRWSGSKLCLPWNFPRPRWLFRIFRVPKASGWTFEDKLDQEVYGGASQGGFSIFRDRTDTSGTAFHEEASWRWPHLSYPPASLWLDYVLPTFSIGWVWFVKLLLCVVFLVLNYSMFKIFELTTLIVQGPNSPFCPFVVSLDRVAIPAQDVASVIAWVQYFVIGHFSRSGVSFFASGITMLYAAIDSDDDVCARAVFDRWETVRVRPHADIVADLKRCRNYLLLPRKTSKNVLERKFGLANLKSSSVDNAVSRTGVRIYNINEVGERDFWPHDPRYPCVPGNSSLVFSPGKSKKGRKINSALLARKKIFTSW